MPLWPGNRQKEFTSFQCPSVQRPLGKTFMETPVGIEPAFITHLFYLCKGDPTNTRGRAVLTQAFIDSNIFGVISVAA